MFFFFSSRRRHTRSTRDWSSDVCSSDLPGAKVTLTVWRKGAQKDVGVTVAELKEDQPAQPARKGTTPKEKAKPNRMGLVLSDLTDEQKKELDIKNGVLIEDVSGGVRGNIQAGDVILAVINK